MSKAAAPRRSAAVVLALLLIAYIFNFLDRQILAILAGPIIKDLELTDTQFGLLSGPPFAIFYSLLGLPFAYLADRTSRSKVIGGAVALWSAFTALCGAAGSFLHLFLFRMGVGVGEAGGVAPSYALIADYFPPQRRARALAIFSLGIPLGSTGGTLIGAYLASWIDWRAAFIAMGIAGVVLAPIMLIFVQDPRRAPVDPQRVPPLQVFGLLARKPSFWLLAFSASFSSLAGYGLLLWTPSVFERSFGLGLIERAQFLGSLLLIGGCAGVFAGGLLADRLGQRDRGWYAKLPAIAWLITAPTFALGLMAPSLWLAWPLLLIPNALNILWLGPVTAAVQHLVERPMRATASASFLLINNLIGLGIGPLLIGHVSDVLKKSYGLEALRYAAVGTTAFYLLAAALMLICIKHLRSAWVPD
jgi:predicted MFS family arabinose efflux permease